MNNSHAVGLCGTGQKIWRHRRTYTAHCPRADHLSTYRRLKSNEREGAS